MTVSRNLNVLGIWWEEINKLGKKAIMLGKIVRRRNNGGQWRNSMDRIKEILEELMLLSGTGKSDRMRLGQWHFSNYLWFWTSCQLTTKAWQIYILFLTSFFLKMEWEIRTWVLLTLFYFSFLYKWIFTTYFA